MRAPNTPAIATRDLAPADETLWRALWQGYLAFYDETLPEAVTAATWARILDPEAPLVGRLALAEGQAVGFSVSVLHAGTWTLAPVCYLEDLFVSGDARGRGVGRALIEDLVALARSRGWSRLYWHTREGNAPARRLYDRFAPADDFRRYRLFL